MAARSQQELDLMAADANIYKTVYCLDAYSTDGDMTDPIFPYPPYYWRGDTGQSRDIQVWIRNDGTTNLISALGINFQVEPADVHDTDESTWIKLAVTQGALGAAVAGDPITIPDLEPGESYGFWARLTVPAAETEANKIDLRLRVTAVSQ